MSRGGRQGTTLGGNGRLGGRIGRVRNGTLIGRCGLRYRSRRRRDLWSESSVSQRSAFEKFSGVKEIVLLLRETHPPGMKNGSRKFISVFLQVFTRYRGVAVSSSIFDLTILSGHAHGMVRVDASALAQPFRVQSSSIYVRALRTSGLTSLSNLVHDTLVRYIATPTVSRNKITL